MCIRIVKSRKYDGHSILLEGDRENAYRIVEEASWKRDIRKIKKEMEDNTVTNGGERQSVRM
jgi:hypothetical protein